MVVGTLQRSLEAAHKKKQNKTKKKTTNNLHDFSSRQ